MRVAGACSAYMAHAGSAFRFVLHLPQHRTEALLRARVAELGGRIETCVELLDLTAGSEYVGARVRDLTAREDRICAGFAVGCDGAHSRVRHLLDAPFTGQPYPWDWLLADTHLDWAGSPTEVQEMRLRIGRSRRGHRRRPAPTVERRWENHSRSAASPPRSWRVRRRNRWWPPRSPGRFRWRR